MSFVLCDIFHFTRDLLYASDCNFFVARYVGSLMIATQAVCGGMLSRSLSVTIGPTCNYPVGLSATYGTIARPVCNYSGPPCAKAIPRSISYLSWHFRIGHHCTFTF